MLTVRQSLVQGTSHYAQKYSNYREAEIASQLSQILSILLPKLTKQNISGAAKIFIQNAVALKAEMVEERAVYQFFWVRGREKYDSTRVQVSVGEHGEVGMCTFPGLSRKVENNGGQEEVSVVRAKAKLMGSLNRR